MRILSQSTKGLNRSGNSSLVCYACVVYDLSGAAHRSGGCAHSGYSLFRIPCSRQFGNMHSPAIPTPDAAVLLSRRENFYTVKQDACAQGSQFLERMRQRLSKKALPFLTKGLQSAARTICAPLAYKSHTCSLIGIFCQVHAPTENDLNPFAACERQTLRGFFDTLKRMRSRVTVP